MNRKLRTLGLTLVTVFALAAGAAQAASANEYHEFHAEREPAALAGEQTEGSNVFSFAGVEFDCTTATFAGSMASSPATQVTIHPEYGKGGGVCALGGFGISATTTGCNYVLHEETGANGPAPVDIQCTAGKAMEFKFIGCTLKVGSEISGSPANQGLLGVRYANTGSGSSRAYTVTAALTGIQYVASGTCPLAGIANGTHVNSEYDGNIAIRGHEAPEGARVGVWAGEN